MCIRDRHEAGERWLDPWKDLSLSTVQSLTIGPPANRYVAAFGVVQVMTSEDCSSLSLQNLLPARTDDPLTSLTRDHEHQVAPELSAALIPHLLDAVRSANNTFFRLALVGTIDDDTPVVRVAGDPPAMVTDLVPEHCTRKLSIVLNTQSECEIRYPALNKLATLPIGAAAIFPAYLSFEPEKGSALLIARVHGPSFT